MKVKFKQFYGTFTRRKTVLQKAAQYATDLGQEKLITISMAEDSGEKAVIVWYWSDGSESWLDDSQVQ